MTYLDRPYLLATVKMDSDEEALSFLTSFLIFNQYFKYQYIVILIHGYILTCSIA
jgi:hypothetical protein